jgi:hypothetical protein
MRELCGYCRKSNIPETTTTGKGLAFAKVSDILSRCSPDKRLGEIFASSLTRSNRSVSARALASAIEARADTASVVNLASLSSLVF